MTYEKGFFLTALCVSGPWALLSLLRPELAGGLLTSNHITLISKFSPSIGMEDQSTLLDWFDWLIDCWAEWIDWLILILLIWFLDCFCLCCNSLKLHLLEGAVVRLVVSIPENLENAVIQFSSCLAYFSSWPESFDLCMSCRLFCCMSHASVFVDLRLCVFPHFRTWLWSSVWSRVLGS